jgi:hypothetical protein
VAQSIFTHYDNLKVPRNAAVADIKLSYRALAQKYHPDRNRAPEALSTMMLINQAWDVLRNPERRARHDRWIASQEQQAARQPVGAPSPTGRRTRARAGRAGQPGAARSMALGKYAMVLCGLVVAAVLVAVVYLANAAAPVDDAPALAVAVDVPQEERARHGELWGDRQDTASGPALFAIDNTGGKVDAYVRMFRDGRIARSMVVHQGRSLELEGVRLGKYVIKYKIVVDGKERAYQARETFALIQTASEAKEGRYNVFNRSRKTTFSVAGAMQAADEIALDQF